MFATALPKTLSTVEVWGKLGVSRSSHRETKLWREWGKAGLSCTNCHMMVT